MTALAAPIALIAGCASTPTAASRDLQRCIWVNRWDFRTPADVNQIMQECAGAGFTTVMFQVRGNGTSLYSSREEVWSEQFGFQAPQFDPLSQAVVAAHSNGLKIHAWVNMLPGWAGDKPPASKAQLFHTRPEWFLRGPARGGGQGGILKEGNYYWLNPCLPEVRHYLAGICRGIAEDYEVDGIHLDYVRFPDDPQGVDAPADARSRQLFAATRHAGRKSGFERWKTESVTVLVQRVREQLHHVRRPVALTVAVYADLGKARGRLHQDWPEWASRDCVDAIFPMVYNVDDIRFTELVMGCVGAADGVPVVAGVGAHWHREPGHTVMQLDAALRSGAGGVAVYGYRKAREPDWSSALSAWSRRFPY